MQRLYWNTSLVTLHWSCTFFKCRNGWKHDLLFLYITFFANCLKNTSKAIHFPSSCTFLQAYKNKYLQIYSFEIICYEHRNIIVHIKRKQKIYFWNKNILKKTCRAFQNFMRINPAGTLINARLKASILSLKNTHLHKFSLSILMIEK